MDIHSNLEYLCRVCAANTKGKNSVAECVYILKTAGLKDKLDTFLYLKISENDSLPKVLCKSCFRQVEATASLSKIAKHTQQVFRDFLLSNLPKGPSESTNTSEFTSSDFMGSRDAVEKSKNHEVVAAPAPSNSLPQLPPPPAPTTLLPPPLLQPLTTVSRKDEVVVNVSVADPLTRDNQQKMISNSQRRQSLLLESFFTPKSIAQKKTATTAVAPRLIAPKPNQQIESITVANNPKSTAPSLTFYPAKPQPPTNQKQPPQPNQITTFSSGGYVIGRIDNTSSNTDESKNLSLPLKPSADNILHQKRKNLVKALNNIKANNSGQVSLLKSAQQKQTEAMQNITKAPLTEVVNQATEDELPKKIIIAAPKNKFVTEKSKKEPLNLSSKIPASITQLPATASTGTVAQQQQEQSNTLFASPPKSAFPEDILLGRVIRDMDLLKLILKALKWPFNKRNMELQIERLKSTKFTDIMSDPNLLQDTDLTQLLGPYLTPVLLAAQALQQQQYQQQQQQQQIFNNTPLNIQNVSTNYTTQPKMTALEAAQAEINKSIPYKLPPETSVQLVPATPEETEATQAPLSTVSTSSTTSASLKRERKKETETVAVPLKKQRKLAAQKARDSIVISDEEDLSTEGGAPKKSRQRTVKSISNVQFELDPTFMSQFNLLNSSGGNEAEELMALLLNQKAALLKNKKVQRRRRNSVSTNLVTLPPSEFDALIDLDDDIVLMEPVSTTNSSEAISSNQAQQEPLQKTDATNTFVKPSVPLITRPIIKRRKTVIHPPKNIFDLAIEMKNKDQTSTSSYSLLKNKDPTPIAFTSILKNKDHTPTLSSSLLKNKDPISSASLLKTKEKHIEETINQVATGSNITNTESAIQQTSTKTLNTEAIMVTQAELSAIKAPQQKKTLNKSSLGQQLLEAIGLQKMSSKMLSNPQSQTNSTSTLSNAITVPPNSKQSIQRIRSALKKSLKQAQEQQQQKKKELSFSASNTIIQDADSTTKPPIKEILVVQGKGNKSDICSSIVDVEDQIDKVTLMVRNNDEDNCQHSTTKTGTTTSEQDEKKELKKSPSTKNQERRRTLLPPGSRFVGARNIADEAKCNEEAPHERMVENNEATDKKEKLEKEDAANIGSSSVAVSNTSSDGVVTPKRRGRKRLIDKQNELEVGEANEKETDHKTISREEESESTTNNKNEEETEGNKTSGRPARQSKTLSKYYKGPDKVIEGRRFLPSRTTRNRKYC